MKFVPKNHMHHTIEKTKFNSKEENGKKPQRMTPHLWKLEYNRHHHGMQIVCNIMNFIFLLNFLYHGCHELLLMCFPLCLMNVFKE